MHRPIGYEQGRIVAVLGPTNTGKTHYAVERMLAYGSGIMGFPLRLLAREIYDRVAAEKGPSRVALLTGEEKIVPPRPAYWICTVESMPLTEPVDFVAVDEIQLAADRQRGHVFTDRLLRARGRYETLLLGSDTIRPLIGRLVPEADVLRRPRFSRLSHTAPVKISRLPRRSAIVAFSADDVYALAELVRRRRGGTAVVMGALSPRTRNAQVGMFEAGEVDYLVATDAIGMGLNMDIDHVAFAALHKFDGRSVRRLEAAEVAQIAGRAGRHMKDGSFSTLAGGEDGPLDPAMIERVENHSFPPVRALCWRNATLDFRSPARLVAALEAPPGRSELVRVPDPPDLLALKALLADPGIAGKVATPDTLRRLWEVCGIPDFRKLSPDDHHALLGRVFADLTSGDGFVAQDWIAREVRRLDDVEGDIDTLAARISGIRIWTYVSHRPDWVHEASHWTARTREVEDRLSDALHERLTRRFVDRRTSVLLRRLRRRGGVSVSMGENDQVVVEGRCVGHLDGLRFRPAEEAQTAEEGRALADAAEAALEGEIARRVKIFANVGYKTLELDFADGAHRPRLMWQGAPIARVVRGGSACAPQVRLAGDLRLSPAAAETVQAACTGWLSARLADKLGPLLELESALASAGTDEETSETALSGIARGIAFRLVERFGVVPRSAVARDLRQLDQEARRGLRRYAIRIGATALYMPALLKPHAAELRLMLWALWTGQRDLPRMPTPGLVWIGIEYAAPRDFYEIAGFRPIGENEAVRLDMLERLADAVRPLGKDGARFAVNPEIMGLVGCSGDSFARAMRAIGYGHEKLPPETPTPAEDEPAPAAEAGAAEPAPEAAAERHLFFWSPRTERKPRPRPGAKSGAGAVSASGKAGRAKEEPSTAPRHRAAGRDEDSPFAQLKGLRDALARKGS